MRFSLLGPLVVADSAGGQVAIAGPRLRVLLAALLLHANIPVPASKLAEMVWDGSPPPGAISTLRSYVRRLRVAVDPGATRITSHDSGYVIRVEQAELDILEFEALCRDTRAALRAGEWADASAAAARALGLWRAAPLLDVPAEALRGEFAGKQKELQGQQAALKAKEESLQKDGATMTIEQRTKVEKDLRDGNRELQQKVQEYQDDFNARQNEELSKLQKALVEEVQTYAQGEKFDLVLADGVIFAGPALDITPQVLAALQAHGVRPSGASSGAGAAPKSATPPKGK